MDLETLQSWEAQIAAMAEKRKTLCEQTQGLAKVRQCIKSGETGYAHVSGAMNKIQSAAGYSVQTKVEKMLLNILPDIIRTVEYEMLAESRDVEIERKALEGKFKGFMLTISSCD